VGKLTESLSFSRQMPALPTEEFEVMSTPTMGKVERDEAASVPADRSGRESAASNVVASANGPATSPKAAGDKSSVISTHTPKGVFRSDGVENNATPTVGAVANERSIDGSVATKNNVSIKVLIGGVSVALVLLVLWRRNSGRGNGLRNGDSER
jgi:hypothetical protein